MKRYDSYKPTGLNWFSEIPIGWEWRFLSQVAHEQNIKKPVGEMYPVMTLSYGEIKRKANIDAGLVPSNYDNYQMLYRGNIVLRLIDLQNDHTSLRTGLVKETGIITSAYTCIAPTENAAYVRYLLHSYDTRKVFYGYGGGVRQSIGYKDIRHLQVPVPPREEKDQIVRYLDWQVSKINRLIAAKKQEIALFEESKINHIANVVLHGIRHHEHCIETTEFGSIPAHWQIIQNKRLFCERVEHSETGTETLLSVSKHYGVKPSAELTEDEQFATIKPALSLVGYKVVRKNDLVMNIMRARNGSYGISDYDGIVSPAYCIYYTTKECNVKYLHYFLRTPHVKSLFEAYSSGIAEHRRRLYPEDFLRLKSVLPPLEEQDEIVEHIEQAIVKYDAGIANLRQQIACLQDMKTRLISDVVTGQVDVRGIEVPEYEVVQDIAAEPEEETEEMMEEV